MKRFYLSLSILCCTIFIGSVAQAQLQWTKTINTANGSIVKIYEPEPESFSGNILKMRSAISVLEKGKTDPVFGSFWAVATVETDKDNRLVSVQSVKIPNIKFPGGTDSMNINYIKTILETEIPKVETHLSLDELLSSLDMNTEEKKLSKDLENNPPKIIYTTQSSILVLIDGTPKFQHNDDWGVDAVVNSPFTIIKNNDGNYYLYGSKHWYKASSATGPYSYVNKALDHQLNKNKYNNITKILECG